MQIPIEPAGGGQPRASAAAENRQQHDQEHPGVNTVEKTFRCGTFVNGLSAFVRTYMSHTSHRLLTALAAQSVAASAAENDRDFVRMSETIHSTEGARAAPVILGG